MANGKWQMANGMGKCDGQWARSDGQWARGHGQGAMGKGRWSCQTAHPILTSGPRTAVSAAPGREAVARSWKTDLSRHLRDDVVADVEAAHEEVACGACQLAGGVDDLLVRRHGAAL